jgi:hypothetical protein
VRRGASIQHQDFGTDVCEDALGGPLFADVGRDHGNAEPLLHGCERGLVARHDCYLGALLDQGLDEPKAQASAAACYHEPPVGFWAKSRHP